MGYYIDRNNPSFPMIKPCLGGENLGTLTIVLIRHHLEAARDHLRAIERLISDAVD